MIIFAHLQHLLCLPLPAYFFYPSKSNLYFPNTPECGACPVEWWTYQKSHLKKMAPLSQTLRSANSSSARLGTSWAHSLFLTEISSGLILWNLKHEVTVTVNSHMQLSSCIRSIKHSFLEIIYHQWLLQSFHLSSEMTSLYNEKRSNIHIPFRVEHSMVSYSLYNDHIRLLC